MFHLRLKRNVEIAEFLIFILLQLYAVVLTSTVAVFPKKIFFFLTITENKLLGPAIKSGNGKEEDSKGEKRVAFKLPKFYT